MFIAIVLIITERYLNVCERVVSEATGLTLTAHYIPEHNSIETLESDGMIKTSATSSAIVTILGVCVPTTHLSAHISRKQELCISVEFINEPAQKFVAIILL